MLKRQRAGALRQAARRQKRADKTYVGIGPSGKGRMPLRAELGNRAWVKLRIVWFVTGEDNHGGNPKSLN